MSRLVVITDQSSTTRLIEPEFPPELPVSQAREEIADAIRAHQVVIVCSDTGSGKTTQLPKICLTLGLGVNARIGHTQPRRIAARNVALRIAEELHTPLGEKVGYKVRFGDHVSKSTLIKVMTDGILLAETRSDPDLLQYDALIIDEAHERSLNIDFILGYLHRLLPRRPDLKVIITSATIDPHRFANHFGGAPIIKVEGRSYPVEMRYRPLVGDDDDRKDGNRVLALLDAVDELAKEPPGDILIFQSSEREIRESAEALRKHHPPGTEILPLFARLSVSEQQRVFKSHAGRRIVLATNVAETSLTVPGIRYVIDPGFARISRYSYRSKVQRLPIESVSQASANQRSGRCGRVAAGICIRLYSPEDYEGRSGFTQPEVQRTNLAGVILQMTDLRLGSIDAFPFVDPPDSRFIRDGYRLLAELGAIDDFQKLTDIGMQLARMPLDPRLARMLVAAKDLGCLSEVLIIVSALTIRDPRDRPQGMTQKADECHKVYEDKQSDFVAYIKLWRSVEEQRRHLSNAQFRKYCRKHYLSYMRLREWQELYRQIKGVIAPMKGYRFNSEPAEYEQIHRALLSGLLGHIGILDDDAYRGARNARFHIFPGSSLFKKKPKWIMSAELVETSKLYARTCAKVEPAWIEEVAGELANKQYFEPHWQNRSAQVGGFVKVTLYGLVLNPKQRINYGPIDPVGARKVFITQALVAGRYRAGPFLKHNQKLLEGLGVLEHKTRRPGILVDELQQYRFYDERIPEGIFTGAAFQKWLKKTEQAEPKKLFMEEGDAIASMPTVPLQEQCPDRLIMNEQAFELNYLFDPASDEDGVTVDIPVAQLNQVDQAVLDWMVPAYVEEKVIALLKSLPKSMRRQLVPIPDFARRCLEARPDMMPDLTEFLSVRLKQLASVLVETSDWRFDSLPTWQHMNCRIIDDKGVVLGAGRDFDALYRQWGERAQHVVQEVAASDLERDDIVEWDFGTLPECVRSKSKQGETLAYPALQCQRDALRLTVFSDRNEANTSHREGLAKLFEIKSRDKAKYLRKSLKGYDKLNIWYSRLPAPPVGVLVAGQGGDFIEDVVHSVIERTFLSGSTVIRDGSRFGALLADGKGRFLQDADDLIEELKQILDVFARVRVLLVDLSDDGFVEELEQSLNLLVYNGFLSNTPPKWVPRIEVYLRAVEKRIEKRPRDLARDTSVARIIRPLEQKWVQIRQAHALKNRYDDELEQFRWMLEEFRISSFCQELKTVMPISEKRLIRQLKKVKD